MVRLPSKPYQYSKSSAVDIQCTCTYCLSYFWIHISFPANFSTWFSFINICNFVTFRPLVKGARSQMSLKDCCDKLNDFLYITTFSVIMYCLRSIYHWFPALCNSVPLFFYDLHVVPLTTLLYMVMF